MTIITDDDLNALLTAYKRDRRVAEDAHILARGTPASGHLQEAADAAERKATEARVVYENRRDEQERQR